MSFRSLLLLTFAFSWHAFAAPEMHTRTFKIPPDFLSCEIPERGSAAMPAAPADPFAAPSENAPPPRKILEAQGISFPEGSSASFDPVTSLLTITNTSANLDLTEAYVETLRTQTPANVAFTLTVIEGPGELIREADAMASRSANAASALAMLLDHTKKPGSAVHVVGDAFLETKSGTRATIEAVIEHSYASDFTLDAKSRSSTALETRPIGLHLEIEPTVGADNFTMETSLSLTLNPAPPTQRQIILNDPLTGNAAEFPITDIRRAQFTTGLSIQSGSTKLIGITKPVGTPKESEDVLCTAFITATLRRVETLPAPQPKIPAPAVVPSGMTFAALHAPDGLFDGVLQYPKPQTLKAWLTQAGITFPSGSLIEHRDGVLRCVNTPDNIALIAALVDHQFAVFARTAAFTWHTLEAPAPFLRDLTRQTLASADDSAMFAAVEAAVASGEARFINSAFVETKSGTHVRHEAICEHRYLSGLGTHSKGFPELSFETRSVGSVLEVEPTIREDGRTLDLTFKHELHPTPPLQRRDHFRDPASQQPFDIPVTDFNAHKITTGVSIAKGSTKLLSLNSPTGRDANGKLWATFLKCDLVPQVAKTRHVPKELTPAPQNQLDPKAWNTRRYRVPPDFLAIGGTTPPKTAKMILESQGIAFPEKASAVFNPATAILTITNTNENLELTEAFLDTIVWDPPIVVTFTTHVLQGPGLLLRRLTAQAASKSNHRAELDELLAAVKAGSVQHLNTARIETKSGTRATAEQVTEHSSIAEMSVDEKGAPFFAQDLRQTGLRVEVEPTVGADGATVEMNIAPEFHTAPPLEHREHVIDTQGRRLEFPLTDYHVSKVSTCITIPDGTARLLSLYKPVGKPEFEKEDILQAIFITCDILRTGE